MIVRKVGYSSDYRSQLRELPENIIKRVLAKEKIFLVNPLHPSLCLHRLKGKLTGLWSISINKSYRIIFKREPNGDLLFISIGKHDVYRSL